jgi:uncharacterized membrane protein YkoI
MAADGAARQQEDDMSDPKRVGWTAGLIVVGALGGGVLASTLTAGAQTTSPPASESQAQTDSDSESATDTRSHRGARGAGGQRSDETVLTGDNAAKAKAAALKALPGATVDRVETEADGNGVYEAHVTKSDGTRATVYFDKDFKVTSVQDGTGNLS